MRKARDETDGNGIVVCCHHDRNGRACVPGGGHPGCIGHDDIDIERNQLFCQCEESILVSFRGAVFDSDVPAFDVTEIAKPLAKCVVKELYSRRRGEAEVTDPGDPIGLLRARRQRPSCRTAE
jgi:hypothetical protein